MAQEGLLLSLNLMTFLLRVFYLTSNKVSKQNHCL